MGDWIYFCSRIPQRLFNDEMLLEIAEDLPNIEADKPQGKISMRPKKADTKLEVVVWYTGGGIAPDNMRELFRELTPAQLRLQKKQR